MNRDEQVHIRCGEDEKRAWEKAASQDDRSLSAWLRIIANKAAQKSAQDVKEKGRNDE